MLSKKIARGATKIVEGRYDMAADAIVVRLSTGATMTVPRTRVPRFEDVERSELRDAEIEPMAERSGSSQPTSA